MFECADTYDARIYVTGISVRGSFLFFSCVGWIEGSGLGPRLVRVYPPSTSFLPFPFYVSMFSSFRPFTLELWGPVHATGIRFTGRFELVRSCGCSCRLWMGWTFPCSRLSEFVIALRWSLALSFRIGSFWLGVFGCTPLVRSRGCSRAEVHTSNSMKMPR
ncbi:hypothetical protein DFP72DRAFT_123762 [Ephemerocybe angulata]|uniref:Uncharacterized protein n=1 Tax=Ephemerocybe angulata TaxID=980116 RepID=A0A8H6HD72_9AGAR|nr:hypothetical protein DFP72DRAFT_123762 [Tulosesus angulatus]